MRFTPLALVQQFESPNVTREHVWRSPVKSWQDDISFSAVDEEGSTSHCMSVRIMSSAASFEAASARSVEPSVPVLRMQSSPKQLRSLLQMLISSTTGEVYVIV